MGVLLDSELKFVFDDAAMVITDRKQSYIVVGDLHIGTERKLDQKGVHLHNASDAMLAKLHSLATTFETKNIVFLGDIKDTILYTDAIDADSIRNFFDALRGYSIVVVLGNHDAHLQEIVNINAVDELLLGKFALLHGNRWPSKEAMLTDYIITAHNHIAVSITDKNGGFYTEKAWLIADLNPEGARRHYESFNEKIKLIIMPAFNDLITGMPVNEQHDRLLNPLLNNKVFDYGNSGIYTVKGDFLGKLDEFVAKQNLKK